MLKFTYDHDGHQHIDETVDTMPLYGIEKMMGVDDTLPAAHADLIKFKAYDDDGGLMAEGLLHDDDEASNQSAALRFAEAEWGCTTIKVLRDGGWTQEIG